MKKVLKVIIVNLSIFAGLLLLGEIAVRILFPNHNNYKRTYPNEYKNKYFGKNTTIVNWPKVSNEFGWVCSDENKFLKFSNPHYNKEDIVYSISQYGFREHKQSDLVKAISILGDSFVFGVYLDDTSTIPSNLYKLFAGKYDVSNWGIPGWGIDQMYRCYLEYIDNSLVDKVILFYIDDDIYRVLESYRFTEGMNKPSYEVCENELVIRKNKGKNIWVKFFQESKFLNPLYKKYCEIEAINITKKIFLALKQYTTKNKQELLIVHIPVKEQVLFSDEYPSLINDSFFYKNSINYLELLDIFIQYDKEYINSLYLKNDSHLSKEGTKFVAKKLFQRLNKNNINE